MHHLQIKARLTQLLNGGYSIEDIRTLIQAPKMIVDQALRDFEASERASQRTLHMQRRQAEYAMHLRCKP